MTDDPRPHPKLRPVDGSPIQYEGAAYLLLRDPLGLSGQTLLVPQPMIPLLALLDGSRSPAALRAALAVRYGMVMSVQRIETMLETLDEACLLENERSRQAVELARLAYRQAPFRPPASAGASYPEDPRALAEELQGYLDRVEQRPAVAATPGNGAIRGIISPHIDYERGGNIYAQVWGRAAAAVREAELAICFGTDHFNEGRPISLTRQNYATPFGTLPTDIETVDALAAVLGVDQAFAGELHHRQEHSIELAAVWMHYIRGGQPIELVPILTGSAVHQLPADQLAAFLDVLRAAARGKKTIVIAAGDLAHVGPAFDTEPVDSGRLSALRAADKALIDAMCAGEAETFLGHIQSVADANNVCGVSPIYLALRLLGPLRGECHGYAVCPADQQQASVVTICGVTLA